MLSSLGFVKNKVTILHVKQEFSIEELLQYFKETNIDVTLPEWLPRRPLICQTIAQLPEADRDAMFVAGGNAVDFWHHFIKVVCERDARINKSFNADTIFDVFVELAHLTRTKSGDVGPISPRELQEAFESIRGSLPVENAAVMLQRLPSLGRIDQESPDRRFIDTYILDGLRAVGVARIVDGDEVGRRKFIDLKWSNPLQPLGQQILAKELNNRSAGFVNLSGRASGSSNKTLAADIIASAARCNKEIDFRGQKTADAALSELDLSESKASNFSLESCTIEELVLPSANPVGVNIASCLIGKVSGVSSALGLPGWAASNAVETYDSVRTMSRIREAGLAPSHEVLVVILKKIFFQPGAGRKEEALMRGFESGRHHKAVKKVISALVAAKFLESFKGKDGIVYTPNRSMTNRAKSMLDELRASQDPLWTSVENI